MAITSAPGKIILFGEHAVLYNKPAIAGAISARTKAEFKNRRNYNEVIFNSNATNMTMQKKGYRMPFGDFEEIYNKAIEAISSNPQYTHKNQELDNFFKEWYEPITILTAKFERDNENCFFPENYSIRILNKVPKGCGAGSSIAAAVVASISKHLKGRWNLKEIYDSVCFSDDLLHAGRNSKLDANTVVYGNFQVKRKGGTFNYFRKNESFPILIVDSGVAARTGAQTKKLDEIIQKNEKAMEWIDEIGLIAEEGIRQVKKDNFPEIGALMYQNHELLKNLEVSCPELDRIVAIAKENNAYGAKLTGAGGGGSAIVLGNNLKKIQDALLEKGFISRIRHVGVAGIRNEAEHSHHNV